jgi:hypothetical protein
MAVVGFTSGSAGKTEGSPGRSPAVARGLGRGGLAVGLMDGRIDGRPAGSSGGRGMGRAGSGVSQTAGALGDSSGPRPPKSSPGPLGVRWRNPSGRGMRDSRRRVPGSALGSPAPPSGGRSEPPAAADPGDRVGLLTAGDSVCDPPSVGDEELTDDLSRGVWVPDENHPDTVRLERATAKGAAFKSRQLTGGRSLETLRPWKFDGRRVAPGAKK